MLKNKAAGFYFGCVAAVLSIVAMGLYLSNISNSYFADAVSVPVMACTIIAIIMIVAYIVLSSSAKKNSTLSYIRGLFPVAATFCLFAACVMFLGTRVYNMAIIYGSSLEANNTLAHSAMAQAIAAIVIYFLAGIMTIVAAFCKTEKDEIR